MHHHGWDSWLHFPASALWMTLSIVWWLDLIQSRGYVVMFLIGVISGGLQIAYLIRKHRRLGKVGDGGNI